MSTQHCCATPHNRPRCFAHMPGKWVRPFVVGETGLEYVLQGHVSHTTPGARERE
jgi:hypothetical protein